MLYGRRELMFRSIVLPLTSALKMEALYFPETLEPSYRIILCHVSQQSNLRSHRGGDFKLNFRWFCFM